MGSFYGHPPRKERDSVAGARQLTAVHAAFGTVIWVVCIAAVVVGLVALLFSRGTWEDYGKHGLLMDSEASQAPDGGSGASLRERDEEIRQMLEARNARRVRRGEEPVDVEQELSRLTAPRVDPGLRAEIRDLVRARNYRRTRAGKPPLDIDAEVEWEISRLTEL
jgi:hypothetical protein